MLTIMGIAARNMNVDLKGTQVTVQKEMVATPLRRIGKLGVQIKVPGKLTDEQKKKLENAANTCPRPQKPPSGHPNPCRIRLGIIPNDG